MIIRIKKRHVKLQIEKTATKLYVVSNSFVSMRNTDEKIELKNSVVLGELPTVVNSD